jgi:very-short-patch-repair endonuclease
LDTFVLRGHHRTRRAETNPGERDLTPQDITTVFGIPVTTPLRTALDLGCRLPRRDALAALDAFMRVYELSREELLREVPRYFRRRGVRQLRGLVALADPRSESPGESWTRLAINDENLPVPQLQWEIRRDGRVLFRLDLAYPGLKICVEYDGEEYHDSIEARLADERRRTWLGQHGWIVIVVTKADFDEDGLARWTSDLRRAIESRRVTVRLRPGRRTPA